MKKTFTRQIITMSKFALVGIMMQAMLYSMLLARDGKAQQVSLSDMQISVNFEGSEIKDVFERLEKITGLNFAYHKNHLDKNLKIEGNFENDSMEEILMHVSRSTDLMFKRINNTIYVSKKTKSSDAPVTESFFQSTSVTGKVTSSDSPEGLPGVNVVVKGTTTGAVTDINGNYRVDVPSPESILIFSSVGYISEEILVGNKSVIDLVLVPDITALEEIVVIGYGTQKKSDLTGSIASVKPEVIQKIATNDLRVAMKGQIAGVSVQGGGEPGNSPNVKIRGVGTINNNDPLYIVDGIQTPVSQVPTTDIESIQVLKDGAAAAIYGSRAANGVIIVTTKRGEKGTIKINYNTYYGWQNITKRYDVTNREQYQMLNNEAVTNAMPYDPTLTLVPTNDPSSPDFETSIDTDWQEEGLRTGTIQEHNLSFSGGAENANYYVSLNYYDHNGTAVGKGPNYDRFSVRVNSDFTYKKLKFGESVQISKEHFDFASFLKDGNYISDLVRAIPTMPVYDENRLGGYGGSDGVLHRSLTNNVIGVNNILSNQSDRYRIVGNIYGELEIVKGLTFKTSGSLERSDWRDTRNQPEYDLGTFFNDFIPKFYDWRGVGYTGSIDNTLTYTDVFGGHRLTVMAGNTALQSKVVNLNARAENINAFTPDIINNAEDYFVEGFENENRLSSYFARIQYDYESRYLLQATIRRDGSSRFGANYRWGNFPSVSVGWKISEEEFLKSISQISLMKLRASYGVLGNQEIGNYGHTTTVNANAHAVFGGQLAFGTTQLRFGNADLRWEETISKNIGLDFGLWDDRFTFTTEYYNIVTEDVLVQLPVPPNSGLYPWEVPFQNAASLKNSGLEFSAGYNKSSGDFKYSVNANFSTLKNEVLSLGGGEPVFGNTSKTEVGGEVGQFFGYVIDGIFQSQEEIDQLNAGASDGLYQEINTSPGDYKFRDLDGDGEITLEDREYLGSAIPKYYFGGSFNGAYRNFDISLNFQGHAGNKALDMVRVSIESAAGYSNYSTNVLDRWTDDNRDTDVPRVVLSDPNGNGRASARWLENGSFFRVSAVQIGYTLPKDLISKIAISNLRIYATGQNLLTITKFGGYDPDFGNDGLFNRGVAMADAPNKAFNGFTGGFPNPRTFTVGLQVQF